MGDNVLTYQYTMNYDKQQPEKTHRDKQLQVRIDDELHDAALGKAQGFGWSLGAVVRALLRSWVEGNSEGPTAEEVGRESVPAEKRPRKRKRKGRG
jgi:hypothetical protein